MTDQIATLRQGHTIPQALFSCHFEGCRAEVSYPADMLYWCKLVKGWVCDSCFDSVPDECEHGISLAQFIEREGLLAVEILKINKG